MKHKLFDNFRLGPVIMRNRMVMAPLTRSRATPDGLPTEMMALHYAQRSSTGLIISEGTVISPQGVAYPRVPGLYNDAQVRAWRKVTEAVHERGGLIFAQLWHVGRQSHSSVQPDGLPPFAPSPVAIENYLYNTRPEPLPYEVPRELTKVQIVEIVQQYADAAERAFDAGFDGVELHGANGYLIDQFLNSSSNRRSDQYGGPVTNRVRFLHQVLHAVAEKIPLNRVGVRLSPSSTWMDAEDPDKKALHSQVITSLNAFGLAYLHLVEPHIAGSTTSDAEMGAIPTADLAAQFDGVVISTGGHTRESAKQILEDGVADLIGFGRLFTSNPDLPARMEKRISLIQPDRKTFYAGREKGYIDYPTMEAEDKWRELKNHLTAVDEAILELEGRSLMDLDRSNELYSLFQLRKLASEAVLNY